MLGNRCYRSANISSSLIDQKKSGAQRNAFSNGLQAASPRCAANQSILMEGFEKSSRKNCVSIIPQWISFGLLPHAWSPDFTCFTAFGYRIISAEIPSCSALAKHCIIRFDGARWGFPFSLPYQAS
jgi:hypothetical protein